MSKVVVVMAAVVAAACVKTTTKQCGEYVCSATSVCSPGGDRCVSQTQLDACTSKGDGDGCSFPGTDVGVCDSAVCVAAGCGNGVVETASDEICDDGNRFSGDGCRSDCKSAEICGDGIEDPAVGEHCDCGSAGMTAPFGCSGVNSMEANASCRPGCVLAGCGDGVEDLHEVCDDGNNVPGDGCRADCAGRWTRLPTTTLATLDSVWATSTSDAWASSTSTVFKWDGVSWTEQTPPDDHPNYVDIDGTPTQGVFVVSSGDSSGGAGVSLSRIWRYSAGVWTDVTPSFGAAYWVAVSATGDAVWIVGGEPNGTSPAGRVARWNAGTSAFEIDTQTDSLDNGLNDVFASPDGKVYVVDQQQAMYVRSSGIWSLDAAAVGVWIVGGAANDITVIRGSIIPGAQNTYHYNGTNWNELANSSDLALTAVASRGGATIGVGSQGGVMVCNATACSGSPNPSTANLAGVWVLNDKEAFLVGALGTILY